MNDRTWPWLVIAIESSVLHRKLRRRKFKVVPGKLILRVVTKWRPYLLDRKIWPEVPYHERN